MAGRHASGSWSIINARVFDNESLSEPKAVQLRHGLIAEERVGPADVIDAEGAALLPGLIDAHVHFDAVENRAVFTRWGVTTALDMGCRGELVAQLRQGRGLTDVRSATSPASGPGGLPTTAGGFDPSTAVAGPDDAERFVADRRSEGADYIKIIIEDPVQVGAVALSVETIGALVVAAHQHDLRVIAHATSTAAFARGIGAGVDVLTHSPLDAELTSDQVQAMSARRIAAIPTLTMMNGIAGRVGMPTEGPGPGYRHAAASVAALRAARIPIIAGTDANNSPLVPFSPPQGESLHDELGLLVAAGLSPVEALRSATVATAELFGLTDRGAIEPGRRADLLLVEGDPTTDISATRNVSHVWVAGALAR